MGLSTKENYIEYRTNICKRCPLYKITSGAGAICNSKLWYNPLTEEVSAYSKPGFKNGCGCILKNKVKMEYTHCPLSKW